MNPKRIFKLTKDLVAIPSETGNEGAIGEFLVKYIKEMGMEVETQEVATGRKNIYAHFPGVTPKILFNTHIDTVPPQYGPDEDDENIYGRGSCDTHGILATQLEAISELHGEGLKDVGILLVVGEETGHEGAIAAAKHFPEPDILIVGEPTDNKLVSGGKGLLGIEIEAHGVMGHSSCPEKFDSAIEKLLALLEDLRRDVERIPPDDVLGRTTLNIGMIEGGVAHNVITDHASCTLLYRLTISSEDAVARIEKILHDANGVTRHPECSRNFTWKLIDTADPLTDVSTLPGFETGVIAFGTDIPFFNWKNSQKYLMGPGSVLLAHRPPGKKPADGEYIGKREMVEGVELYEKLVKDIPRKQPG